MNQWPLPKRRDFISQLEKSKPLHHKQLEFQNKPRAFGVYDVSLYLPCYRLSNGRTRSAQQEIIARETLPSDFFAADPDSEPALEKQHEILRKMVTIGTDEEILNILRKSPQTDPLILDPDGYVINGNRRLCAMRLLYEENPKEYQKFEYIQVLFLPPCSSDEIDELEVKFQWLPDGRADYSWVDKAMMLRDRRMRGWHEDKLSKLYEMSKADIRKCLAMLEDAETYLDERGWRGEYSRVLRNELAFEKLQKGRSQCEDDEAKKQFFTSVAYLMLDDPDATGRRLYDSIPDALKFADEVAVQLRNDFPEDIESIVESTKQTENKQLDLLGDDYVSSYADVAELVSQSEYFDQIRVVVRDKIEEMRTRAREQKDARYCLKEVQKANTALINARNNLRPDSLVMGIEAQLDSIEVICKELRRTIIDGNYQT